MGVAGFNGKLAAPMGSHTLEHLRLYVYTKKKSNR